MLAEMLILDSIECHENISGQITSLMQLFDFRLALERPRLLRKTGTAASLISANAGMVEHLRRKDRRVFYKDFRNELTKLGLWKL